MVAFRPRAAHGAVAFAALTLSPVFLLACGVNVDDLFQQSDGSGGTTSNGPSGVTSTSAPSTGSPSATSSGKTSVTTGPGDTSSPSVQASSSTGPMTPKVACGATAGSCEVSNGGRCVQLSKPERHLFLQRQLPGYRHTNQVSVPE